MPSNSFIKNIAFGLIALTGALFSIFPLTDTDIWWHLATAREIVRTHGFLDQDPFAFTPTIQPWINLHWIYQLISLMLFSIGQVWVLIGFKAAIIAITIYVLLQTFKDRLSIISSATIFIPALFFIRFQLDYRPILFSICYMALFLFLLERYHVTKKRAFLWWLLPIQLVWINTQGLFLLGPLLVLCYIAETFIATIHVKKTPSSYYHLLSTAIFLLIMTPLNPNGFAAIRFPFSLVSRILPGSHNIFSHAIAENIPLWTLYNSEPLLALSTIILITIGFLTFFLTSRPIRIAHLFLWCGFALLACLAKRNILLFIVIALPILALNISTSLSILATSIKTSYRRLSTIMPIVIVTCIAATFATLHTRTILGRLPANGIALFATPHGAVDYLKRHPIEGNIFNTDRFGGYLLWELYPSKKVFIDDRLILRSSGFFGDYLNALGDKTCFDILATRYNITHVLLQCAVFDLAMPLARALYADTVWKMIYADGVSTLFTRLSPPTAPIALDSPSTNHIVKHEINQTYQDEKLRDEALSYYVMFLLKMGQLESARAICSTETRQPFIYFSAYSLFLQNNFDQAQKTLEKTLKTHPHDSPSNTLLNQIKIAKKNRQTTP